MFLVTTLGGVASCTVTVAVLLAELPLLSVTVRVTVLGPFLVQSKLDGLTTRLVMAQLSLELLSTWAAVMLTWPLASRFTSMLCVRTVGGAASCTVTVAVQVPMLPWPSLAVSVTVFGPMLAQVKELGLTETRFTVPQLSEPDRKTSAGAIEAVPEPFNGTVMFLQAIDGGSLSVTVTVKGQDAVALSESVAVRVT